MTAAFVGSSLVVEDASLNTSKHLLDMCGGNTGNFAYIRGLWGLIGTDFEHFRWNAPPEAVKERCNVVVLACANQLGPHTDLGHFAEHLERIGLPILAFGLGAQAQSFDETAALTEGTRRWVHVLAAHAPTESPNIGVRGEFSRRVLERLGLGERVSVTGCPSNFINLDPLLSAKLEKKYGAPDVGRVGVAAGLPYWPELQKIEEALADIVEATQGMYVAQHEINMIRLARSEFEDIDAKTLNLLNRYIRPKLNQENFKLWCRRNAVSFIDAASWMEALRNVDFVVGPRFHGVMLAMQAGTPGGVIAHDSRTLEMCQTMQIPVRHSKDIDGAITLNGLRSLFAFDAQAYGARRIELASRTIDILRSGGVTPAAAMKALVDAGALEQRRAA